MSNIVQMPVSHLSVVSRVSVHIAEYSAENGGRDPNEAKLWGVEVLFPDGKWSSVGFFKTIKQARSVAKQEAKSRDAVLLSQCLWPNREVTQ